MNKTRSYFINYISWVPMYSDFTLVRYITAYYPICTIRLKISIISTFVGRYLRGYWKYNWLTYTSSFYLIIFISHVNPWARITTSVSINRVNSFTGGTQDNAERGLVFEHYEFNTRALVFFTCDRIWQDIL